MTYFMNTLPSLYDQGISGYFYSSISSLRGFSVHPGNLSGIANANALWKDTLEKIQSFDGMKKFQSKPYEFKSYKEFYEVTYGSMESEMSMSKLRKRHGPGETMIPSNKGLFRQEGRLLGAQHLRSPKILDSFEGTLAGWSFLMAAPGLRAGDGKDTSVHPGWRKAMVSISAYGADGFRTLAPDMGVYQNEVSLCR